MDARVISQTVTGTTAAVTLSPGGAREQAAEQCPRRAASRHGWFSLIWIIYLVDYADRFAVSAVLPAIQQEFSLNDAQLGLMSGSLFLGLAILAVPCGLAVDRFSRKYMISLMTVVWSVATWLTGQAASFGQIKGVKTAERVQRFPAVS